MSLAIRKFTLLLTVTLFWSAHVKALMCQSSLVTGQSPVEVSLDRDTQTQEVLNQIQKILESDQVYSDIQAFDLMTEIIGTTQNRVANFLRSTSQSEVYTGTENNLAEGGEQVAELMKGASLLRRMTSVSPSIKERILTLFRRNSDAYLKDVEKKVQHRHYRVIQMQTKLTTERTVYIELQETLNRDRAKLAQEIKKFNLVSNRLRQGLVEVPMTKERRDSIQSNLLAQLEGALESFITIDTLALGMQKTVASRLTALAGLSKNLSDSSEIVLTGIAMGSSKKIDVSPQHHPDLDTAKPIGSDFNLREYLKEKKILALAYLKKNPKVRRNSIIGAYVFAGILGTSALMYDNMPVHNGKTVTEIVRIADGIDSNVERGNFILSFESKYISSLKPKEVLVLGTIVDESTNVQLVANYIQAQTTRNSLKTSDLVNLVDSTVNTTSPMLTKAVLNYIGTNSKNFKTSDIMTFMQALPHLGLGDLIANTFLAEKISELSVGDAIDLADAMSSVDQTTKFLVKYVQARGAGLSNVDRQRLSEAFTYPDFQQELTRSLIKP
jgi:hypothetical protein